MFICGNVSSYIYISLYRFFFTKLLNLYNIFKVIKNELLSILYTLLQIIYNKIYIEFAYIHKTFIYYNIYIRKLYYIYRHYTI